MDDTARRRQILEAARQLLCHYGPHKTTVADIARAAHVGVGSVYLEFSSKEAIIEELSSVLYDRVLSAMRGAALDRRSACAKRLQQVMTAKVRVLMEQGNTGQHARDLMHCPSPAVRAAQQRFSRAEVGLVTELLAEGAAGGELSLFDRPELVATTVLRAYAVFSPPWLFLEAPEQIERALDGMHRLVLHGLLDRQPAAARRRRTGA